MNNIPINIPTDLQSTVEFVISCTTPNMVDFNQEKVGVLRRITLQVSGCS